MISFQGLGLEKWECLLMTMGPVFGVIKMFWNETVAKDIQLCEND
jgi:hypothetical protein